MTRLFRSPAHMIGFLLILLALLVTCMVPRTEFRIVRNLGDFASNRGNDIYLIVGILSLLSLAYANRSRTCALRVVYVMLTVTAITQLLKWITGNLLHILLRPSGGPGGFPSGHTSAACALAYLLSERLPRFSIVWYGAAGVIGWSRLETGAHYPYQIISGAILGLAIGVLFSNRLPYAKFVGEVKAETPPSTEQIAPQLDKS